MRPAKARRLGDPAHWIQHTIPRRSGHRMTTIDRARDIFADYIDMGRGYEPSPDDAKVLLDAFEAAEAQLERVREALTYVDQGQTLVVRSRILRALDGEDA